MHSAKRPGSVFLAVVHFFNFIENKWHIQSPVAPSVSRLETPYGIKDVHGHPSDRQRFSKLFVLENKHAVVVAQTVGAEKVRGYGRSLVFSCFPHRSHKISCVLYSWKNKSCKNMSELKPLYLFVFC